MKHQLRPIYVAMALGAALSSVPAWADELGQIVVTATRMPTLVNEILSDVSIVEREQIARSSAASLPELLSTLPGVQITKNGGLGASGSISLRGTNSNQTLVLVDGQRISSATTGTTALEHLPLDQIERIEVLKGPASSLYGSDAVGGVVQVFTRQAQGKPIPNLSFGLGSYGTQTGSLGYGGQMGDSKFNLQAGWETSDSYSSIRAAKGGLYDMYNPDDDDYRNRNLSAKLSHWFSEQLEVGGQALHITSRKKFDSANCDDFGMVCTANYDNRQRQTLSSYSAYLSYKATPFWKTTFNFGQSQDKTLNWRFDPTALVSESRQNYDTTQNQFSWQNEFALAPAHRLMALLDWRKVSVESTQAFVFSEQETRSIGIGYQGRVGSHSLQANLRRDRVERLDSHDTGSVAYGYHFDRVWTARLGFGTAFHAPTFNDLYWPLDLVNFFQGNPNLKPERARNREIGLSFDQGSTTAAITVFHNRVSDLLDYVPGTAPAWIGTYGNLNSATLKGVSFNYAQRSDRWEVRTALDLLSAKDDETGKTLQRRAPQTGTLEIRRHLGRYSLGMQIQGVSERYNNKANTQVLGGYGLLNLDTNFQIDRDWSVFAKLNNVFDKEYTLVRSTMGPFNDYQTAGRNVFVGLRYSPK